MKILKGLGFFLLALLVFCGFITPFSIVPKNFEAEARERTLERLEQTGTVVDESYINTSVEEAIHANLHTIYRTAIIISLIAAIIVGLCAVRPPHDCGGINLFNPFALPLIGIISVCCALGIALVLDSVPGQGVNEFKLIINTLNAGCAEGFDRILAVLLIPVLLEVIFRGYIFSFFEKLHFSVAIVLSTVLYGLAAFYCIYSYSMRSIGSAAAAEPAMFIAFFIGAVLSVMTWRLRSGIPAVLSHIIIANSAPLVEKLRGSGFDSLPLVIIILAISLALLVFLPILLSKKYPIFAYDYPFTSQHRFMESWFGRKKRRTKRGKARAEKPAAGADMGGSPDLPNLVDDGVLPESSSAIDTEVTVADAEPEPVSGTKAQASVRRSASGKKNNNKSKNRARRDLPAKTASETKADKTGAAADVINVVEGSVDQAAEKVFEDVKNVESAANAAEAQSPVPAGIAALFGLDKENAASEAVVNAQSRLEEEAVNAAEAEANAQDRLEEEAVNAAEAEANAQKQLAESEKRAADELEEARRDAEREARAAEKAAELKAAAARAQSNLNAIAEKAAKNISDEGKAIGTAAVSAVAAASSAEKTESKESVSSKPAAKQSEKAADHGRANKQAAQERSASSEKKADDNKPIAREKKPNESKAAVSNRKPVGSEKRPSAAEKKPVEKKLDEKKPVEKKPVIESKAASADNKPAENKQEKKQRRGGLIAYFKNRRAMKLKKLEREERRAAEAGALSERAAEHAAALKAAAAEAERNLASMAEKASKAIANSTPDKE